jgi:hypothetical protein
LESDAGGVGTKREMRIFLEYARRWVAVAAPTAAGVVEWRMYVR